MANVQYHLKIEQVELASGETGYYLSIIGTDSDGKSIIDAERFFQDAVGFRQELEKIKLSLNPNLTIYLKSTHTNAVETQTMLQPLCPYLHRLKDQGLVYSYPSIHNYCHTKPANPLEVSAQHQEFFCLTSRYPRCPMHKEPDLLPIHTMIDFVPPQPEAYDTQAVYSMVDALIQNTSQFVLNRLSAILVGLMLLGQLVMIVLIWLWYVR